MLLENTKGSLLNLKDKFSLILKSDEAHIWSLNLQEEKRNVQYLASLLSKDEQKKALNFKFSEDQKRFLITRGTLRCILAKYLEEPPQNINIIYGPWGKPYLSQEKALHFNISHSGNYAMLAFTRNYEVGIDLEYINSNLELEEMALIILSNAELNYWKKLHNEEKIDFFFKAWVGKEAFLKAIGKGWLANEEYIKSAKLGLFVRKLSDQAFQNKLGFLRYFQNIPGYASAFFVKGPLLQPIFFNW